MPRAPQGPWFWNFAGWWVVQIRGERVKLARGRENKKAALQRYHEIMATLPESPESPTVDVGSLFEAYLRWQEENNSVETLRGYKFYLQAFVDVFGQRKVRSLRVADAEGWLKKKRTWNDSTKRNAVRNVKAALNWAVRKEYLSVNPLASLEAPTPSKRVRCVTDEEHESLVEAALPEFREYLIALRFTGARPAELRNIRWSERSGNRFILHDHKTVKKTKKPRVIYLSDGLAERIDRLQEASKSEFVFTNTRRKQWTYNATRLQFDRLKKKLGLADDLTLYSYRHRFITDALAADVPLPKLCEMVGHSNPDMIMKVYGHLIEKPKEMLESINLVAQTISGGKQQPAA